MSPCRPVTLLLCALLLGAAGALLLWRLQDDAPPAATRIELLADVERARFESQTRRIRFGSEQGKRHYSEPDPRLHRDASGFKSLGSGPDDSHAAAIGQRAELRFFRLEPGPVEVALEGAGLSATDRTQHVEVRVNDSEQVVASFELPATSSGLSRRTFTIGADEIRPGSNRIEFGFERTEPWLHEGEGIRYARAALFKSIEFDPDPTGEVGRQGRGTASRNAGRALDVEPLPLLQDREALLLPEASRIGFAQRLAEAGGRLVTSLLVHPSDRAERTVPVSIFLVPRDGERRLLFKSGLDASVTGSARVPVEVDLDLAGGGGGHCLLEFEVAPASTPARGVRVAIVEPVILAPPPAPPETATPEPRLEPLRARLDGHNLLIVLLDAAASRHYRAYGARDVLSPAVHQLASSGVVFERMTSPASYTLASVGSLLTGVHPDTHGVVASGTASGTLQLSRSLPTLAEGFAAAGYQTLALVTNPNAGAQFGYDRGFDTFDALYDPALGLWNEGVPVQALVEQFGERLAQLDAGRPFLAYVHVFQPHAPYRPPARFQDGVVDPGYVGPVDGTRESIDRYKEQRIDPYSDVDFQAFRDLYRANLRYADSAVEALLEQLEQRSLRSNTVVCVLSDHGEALGEHLSLEHGDTVYGEQVEVPWILSLPGEPGHGEGRTRRISRPSSLIDVAPTLLSLLSVPVPQSLEGADLVAELCDSAVPERPHFLRSSGALPRFGVRSLGHSFHFDSLTRQELLFDLEADPLELDPLGESRVMHEWLRTQLCRFLCGRIGTGGEPGEIPPDLLKQLEEIGYVQVALSAADGCPLLRRRLDHSSRPR